MLRMVVVVVERLFVVVYGDKDGDENKSTKTIMEDLQILVCYKVSIKYWSDFDQKILMIIINQ